MVLSFEPNEGPYEKEGKPSKISQGSKITYTITYGNDFNNTTLTNLVIVEDYDPRMSLLSADPPPDPGTTNVWTIGNVSPGQYGRIVLVMKMVKQNFVADVDGRVSGNGFVSVRRRFTTEREPHLIINQVRISCDQLERRGEGRDAGEARHRNDPQLLGARFGNLRVGGGLELQDDPDEDESGV
jgi:hypothetical protein